jgi:hypothetical protein
LTIHADQSAGANNRSRGLLDPMADAQSRRVLIALITIAGFAVPVFAYVAFVQHFGVNVVIYDQWSDVALIGRAFSGHLSVGTIWAQHNQNRIFFPNLLVLAFGYLTHLDVHVEEYFSALLLVVAVGLIIWTHRRRSPQTPMIWYCPVVILMLSWVQFENSLWGFQLAWYVVIVCLAGTLAVLDRDRLNAVALVVAVVIAIIGSYSSLQGLLIWPAGLVLLLYRRSQWRVVLAWIAAALITTGLYFYNLHRSQLPPDQINPLHHPIFATKLFFFSLGNVAGKPKVIPLWPIATPSHFFLGSTSPLLVTLGVSIFVASVLAIAKAGTRNTRDRPEPLGVALILVGLGFDLLTVIGRGLHGYAGVSASRYTTFNMLAIVGAYLVVISRPAQHSEGAGGPRYRRGPVAWLAPVRTAFAVVFRLALRALPAVVIACVILVIVFGYANGLSGARQDHMQQTEAVRVFRAYPSNTAGTLGSSGQGQYDIFTGFSTQLIPIAQRDKLSSFGSG